MTTDNDTQTWEIDLLTPLHIGDGSELQHNLDYMFRNKAIDVIEFDSLLECLSDYPLAITDLGKSVALDRLLRDYKVTVSPIYSLPIKGNVTPKSFRRFLKNGHGQPYIAGSSLKGAIHTALWMMLDRSQLPSASQFNPFNRAVKSLGGSDPYHMFIRPLQISDSIGIEPQNTLLCEEIKFFNLQRENKPGWKDFGTRQTKDKFQDTSGLFVECLKPGVKLCLQARIDPFLNSNQTKKIGGITECAGLSSFHALTKAINTHSLHIAEREKIFFSEYRTETAHAADFYKNLIDRIKSLEPDSQTAFLRLSWGSGWRGMTGDWMNDNDLRDVRYQKNLGKKGADVFPKSRRLAIDPAKGTPCLPLGWVQVRPVDKSRFVLNPIQMGDNVSRAVAEPVSASPPVPRPDTEAEYQAKLAQFKNRVEKCKNFQGEIGSLIAFISAQQNERLTKALCIILQEKANSLPKKAYIKALNENKSWATTLKTLLEK